MGKNLQSPVNGKIAFLFPGQGSQYINMAYHMVMHFDAVREIWDKISEIDFGVEERLYNIVFPGYGFNEENKRRQTEKLTRTEWAQPAIGAISISLLNLLNKLGVKADFFGGHSYGEITALYAAGLFDTMEDFIRVSRKKGELMAEAATQEGAMTAVFTSSLEVKKILTESGTDISIANINSPSQTVISGKTSGIERVEKLLTNKGINYKRLPVSTAFHSKIIGKSTEPFYNYLKKIHFNMIENRVFSGSTGNLYPADTEEIRKILAEQIENPVFFQQQIENMYDHGVRIFVEVGPGAVLTGLVSDILKDKKHLSLSLDKKGQDGLISFWNAMGKLSSCGVEISCETLWKEFKEPEHRFAGLVGRDTEIEIKKTEKKVRYSVNNGAKFDDERLKTLQILQQNIFEAHKIFQKTLTESHIRFLQASEEALKQIGGIKTAAEISSPENDLIKNYLAEEHYEERKTEDIREKPEDKIYVPSVDYKKIILQTASEKTGYPEEMLDLNMDMEEELGIDSIKKIEILSDLKLRLPDSCKMDTDKLALMRNFREILDYVTEDLSEKKKILS
ncbi:MAG TPA: acyltransferase domain-containing protein [Candidatus Eremiobacteraeota bacterium]|nr:MAG: Polyketide biosynthesis malonyl CoA-acyl carrier protein transacylase BaeC [bacterium ADurb.Bin363]HPZ08785.1 acyltransferase domain-containing protein [Candidatus Eremiobacteraeota bacterium]